MMENMVLLILSICQSVNHLGVILDVHQVQPREREAQEVGHNPEEFEVELAEEELAAEMQVGERFRNGLIGGNNLVPNMDISCSNQTVRGWQNSSHIFFSVATWNGCFSTCMFV